MARNDNLAGFINAAANFMEADASGQATQQHYKQVLDAYKLMQGAFDTLQSAEELKYKRMRWPTEQAGIEAQTNLTKEQATAKRLENRGMRQMVGAKEEQGYYPAEAEAKTAEAKLRTIESRGKAELVGPQTELDKLAIENETVKAKAIAAIPGVIRQIQQQKKRGELQSSSIDLQKLNKLMELGYGKEEADYMFEKLSIDEALAKAEVRAKEAETAKSKASTAKMQAETSKIYDEMTVGGTEKPDVLSIQKEIADLDVAIAGVQKLATADQMKATEWFKNMSPMVRGYLESKMSGAPVLTPEDKKLAIETLVGSRAAMSNLGYEFYPQLEWKYRDPGYKRRTRTDVKQFISPAGTQDQQGAGGMPRDVYNKLEKFRNWLIGRGNTVEEAKDLLADPDSQKILQDIGITPDQIAAYLNTLPTGSPSSALSATPLGPPSPTGAKPLGPPSPTGAKPLGPPSPTGAKPGVQEYSDAISSSEIYSLAQSHGLEIEEVLATVKVESNFDPEAKSKAGAIGLMQVMPTTAGITEETLKIPKSNIMLGMEYLGKLKNIKNVPGGNSVGARAGMYNVGPTGYMSGTETGWLPEETINHIKRVQDAYNFYKNNPQEAAKALNRLEALYKGEMLSAKQPKPDISNRYFKMWKLDKAKESKKSAIPVK